MLEIIKETLHSFSLGNATKICSSWNLYIKIEWASFFNGHIHKADQPRIIKLKGNLPIVPA